MILGAFLDDLFYVELRHFELCPSRLEILSWSLLGGGTVILRCLDRYGKGFFIVETVTKGGQYGHSTGGTRSALHSASIRTALKDE